MDLKKSLIGDPSKNNAISIAKWVGRNEERMTILMDVFLNGNYRETQRAAYPLLYVTNMNPEMFNPFLEKMISFMTDDVHISVLRNSLRLFQQIDIPEDLEGILYDKCYKYLSSPKYPVAVRVYAMSVLVNLSCKYPELKIEVIPLIKDVLEIYDSPGMRSRGKKALKVLKDLPSK